MKKSILLLFTSAVMHCIQAQTKEELLAALNPKKDSIAAIQARANAIQAQIKALPGWRLGAFGTIGGSFSNYTNWYTQAAPNNTAGNIGFTFNAFANLKQDNFFWKNAANINLGWVRLNNRDIDTDAENFEPTNDVFQLTTLFGWILTKSFALSTLAEYRTTLIEDFNNPGYLDVGIGGTWTPLENLIVVIHPLNYNFVFSDQKNIYQSSLGAKVVADYTRNIGQIGFKSNLSTFFSFENPNLNNTTWTNGFSYTLWKAFGVGFDFALRSNRQEALDYTINTLALDDPSLLNATLETVDNELQSYWILGVSYSF